MLSAIKVRKFIAPLLAVIVMIGLAAAAFAQGAKGAGTKGSSHVETVYFGAG
jgi:hypothetical protein